MLNNLIGDMSGDLLIAGISVIWGKAQVSDLSDLPGGPDILPLPAELRHGHAIWCMSERTAHYGPCVGEWDVSDMTGEGDNCPFDRLTLQYGDQGVTTVDVTLHDGMSEMLDATTVNGRAMLEYAQTTLNDLVSRVIVTAAENCR